MTEHLTTSEENNSDFSNKFESMKSIVLDSEIEKWCYIDDMGHLFLKPYEYGKERFLTNVTLENVEEKTQLLKADFEKAVLDLHELVDQISKSEDKVKLLEKLESQKNYINNLKGIGNFEEVIKLIQSTEKELNEILDKNIAQRKQIIDKFNDLLAHPFHHIKETDTIVEEFTSNWKKSGTVKSSIFSKLQENFQKLRDDYTVRRREAIRNLELEELNNLSAKLEIIEKAESISNTTDWKKGHEDFQKLFEEWKSIGHVPRNKSDEIWLKFKSLKDNFYNQKKAHFDLLFQSLEENFDKKIKLVEQIESIKDSTDWKVTSLKIEEIEKEFNSIGKVPDEKVKEMLDRFFSAKRHFFNNKKEHFNTLNTEYDKNQILKTNLAAKADSMKDSTRWKDTSEEFQNLMNEWKTIGSCKRKIDNELWEKFIQARKHFFNRKDNHFNELRQKKYKDLAFKQDFLKQDLEKFKEELIENEESLINVQNSFASETNERMKLKVQETIDYLQNNVKKLKDKISNIKQQIEDFEKNTNGKNKNEETKIED